MSEKFCLRWNDFESNISSALKDLKDDEDFLNVTLVAGEEQAEAHSLILAACSPFFKTVLKRNKHSHPLLYLKGVRYPDLLALLDFIYYGEVNIAQDDLNSFLAVAEDLKIKGLTQGETQSKPETRPSKDQKRRVPPPQALSSSLHTEDIQEVTPLPVKSEPAVVGVVAEDDGGHYGDEYAEYGFDDLVEPGYDDTEGGLLVTQSIDENKEQKMLISNLIWERISKLGGGSYQCTECGLTKTSSGLTSLKNHIELKHLNNSASYQCEYCNKVCYTANAFHQHLQIHKNK